MGYDFELDNQTAQVLPVYRAGGFDLQIDGRVVRARLEADNDPGCWTLDVDGRRESVWIAQRGDQLFIHLGGRSHRVSSINALERARREADPGGGDETISAPMPGTVVEIMVSPGDEVEAGQLIMTIESMKLQTAITSAQQARVAEVCVSAGASFDQGTALVRLVHDEDQPNDDESADEKSGTSTTSGQHEERTS